MGRPRKQVTETTETEVPQTVESFETLGEPTPPQQNKEFDSIESEFSQMEKTVSNFSADESNDQPPEGEQSNTPTPADLIKIRMFLGFACFVLAGLNTIILNWVNGTVVPMSEMKLKETEIDSLMIYLNNEEVLKIVNTVPTWAIGLCHLEFMFISKYNAVSQNFPKELKEIKPETK